jgi:hypothetical protein
MTTEVPSVKVSVGTWQSCRAERVPVNRREDSVEIRHLTSYDGLSLFDTIDGFQHTAFTTNTCGYDIAALECRQRQRARAEDVI